MDNKLIYLDNAATSFPKPRKVIGRMVKTYTRLGVSPGRGSYDLSMEAADLIFQTRQKLARIFFGFRPKTGFNWAVVITEKQFDELVAKLGASMDQAYQEYCSK